MDIETMTEQQIIEYLRSARAKPNLVGLAKSNTIERFFTDHAINPVCPVCCSTKRKRNGTNGSGVLRYHCHNCGKEYSITTNTIFDHVSLSVDEMVSAVHAVISGQSTVYMENNVASSKLYNSEVWLLTRKIQHILASMPTPDLNGVIEVDEKYIREAQKGSRSLVSYLDDADGRNPRRHNYRSECGIFGPEFVNVLCAVDHEGHFFAECVCLGPLGIDELDKLKVRLKDVAYICTDNYNIYKDWCETEGYKHYIEPSTYRKERMARGYVNTDNIYHTLTAGEYARNETINRAMYKEGRYPHIENSNHKIGYDEFIAIRNKFHLGINGVNSFHSQLNEYIIENARNVSSEYLQDCVKSFTWLLNYRSEHHIRSFSKQDAVDILVEMCRQTIKTGHSPTLKDIRNKTTADYRRPSNRAITLAKRQMQSARKIIKLQSKDANDMSAYEGNDDSVQYLFNKEKFFRDIGTIRLNELARLYGVYDRKEDKATRIRRLSTLPDAQDIIFYEVMVSQYGDMETLKEAIERRPQKRKRGRPCKVTM